MSDELRVQISDKVLLSRINSFCLSTGKSRPDFFTDVISDYLKIQKLMEDYGIDFNGLISCVETYEQIRLSSEEILTELKKISDQCDQSSIKQLLLEIKQNSDRQDNQSSDIKLEISDEFFDRIKNHFNDLAREFYNISSKNFSAINEKIENQKLAISQIKEKMKPVIVEKKSDFFELFSLTSLKFLVTWIIIITALGYTAWINVKNSIDDIENKHFQRYESVYARSERWFYFLMVNDLDNDFNDKIDAEIKLWSELNDQGKRQEVCKKSVVLMRKEVKKK